MARLVQRTPARKIPAREFTTRGERDVRVAEEILAVLRHQDITIQRRR